ncbi:MAG TPA: O-antigen ligase family protein, partial [Bryobacteraceae bacterium]|nr:O-antigen ligase family protein [Bryobacteraceae bacterium]
MSAPPAKSRAEMAAYGFTFAAACAPFVSIAASQILLGAALVAVLIHYRSLRMPRGLAVPLVLFFAGTLIALALSPDPRAGFPQLKKFYVYLILPVAYTAFSGLKDVRRIVLGWTVLASASGTWSFVQFFMKRQKALAAGEDFYRSYIGDRTTGFMSHWMTFGAEQMMALLLLLSALIFGLLQRHKILLWSGMAVISLSIVLGQTRSVWLGSALGAGYLIAAWRPKLLLVLPFAMPLGWFAAPRSVQERVISIYRPHGTTDSNQHRVVTARTGIEMIIASPWVGLGPEIVCR